MHGFLGDCQRIEQLAEVIYQQLASRDIYDDRIRKTFHKLSRDEGSHARQIDLVQQASLSEKDAFPKVAGEKVTEALTLAQQLLAEVDSKDLNEEEALRRALLMEQQFVLVHAHNVLHFNNQRLAELFESLGREDQEHVAFLKECLTWWHAERKCRSDRD